MSAIVAQPIKKTSSVLRALRAARDAVESVPPRLLTIIAAIVVGLLLARAAGAQQPERFVLGGDRVALYNLVGQVRVEPGTGSEVTVELTRGGRDAHELDVEVGGFEGAQALRVLYPSGRIVYPELGRGRVQLGMTGVGRTRARNVFGSTRWEIRGSGSGTEAWADAVVRVPAGKRVEIHLAAGEMIAEGVEGDLVLDGSAASATAERVRGSLLIDLGSGSAHVRDLDGDLIVDTGSGAVRLDRVRGGDFRVDTGSGSVRARDVAAAAVLIDTGSGGVDIDGLSARDIRVDTGSGSVRLALLGDVDDVEIDTGSGGVELVVPGTLGAELVVDTGSGGIRVDAPHYVVERERDFLRAELGDARGRLRVDTGSGSIRILKG